MTLFQLIDRAVQAQPHREAIMWIDGSGERQHWRADELHGAALARAAAMRALGLRCDDLLLLALGYDRELLPLFLGGTYGGAVPALLPYLTPRSDTGVYAERVARLALQTGAAAVLCAEQVRAAVAALLDGSPCRVLTPTAVLQATGPSIDPVADDSSTAAVQFTSGTTGTQKGVCLSHQAICRFLDQHRDFIGVGPGDGVVSWLPLYHDMGLITSVLLPLATQMPSAIMSPAYWVRSPGVMLRLMHELGGTLSWMPNFAFRLIARSVRDAELDSLDLRRWRFCANGAEIVREDSIAAFCQRLAPCGFRREALRVGYGMAENVLTATFTSSYPRIDWVSVSQMQRYRRAAPREPGTDDAAAVVSVGAPLDGVELAIVDEEGRQLGEREIGEISLRSRHLFSGYYRRPDLTAAACRDGWFRSGDLGYLAGGELYICGRQRDLIIVAGHNVYPEDVEAIAERTPGVLPGRAVAFGIQDSETGTERIVLVCELRAAIEPGAEGAIDLALRRGVFQQLDVTVGAIRFVERGWVVKTTSGKHARGANRDKYLLELTPRGHLQPDGSARREQQAT